MALKAAFIFVAEGADPKVHRAFVKTPSLELTTVGVCNYAEAESVAKELVKEGVAAIELCGGFGHEGVARIAKATRGKAAVGVVRFDSHPGLGGKSGDEMFS
jgi:hypothetical protein